MPQSACRDQVDALALGGGTLLFSFGPELVSSSRLAAFPGIAENRMWVSMD